MNKTIFDFEELKQIAKALNMDKKELFEMWKKRMMEYLKEGGFNLEKNQELLNSMFECARKKIVSDS